MCVHCAPIKEQQSVTGYCLVYMTFVLSVCTVCLLFESEGPWNTASFACQKINNLAQQYLPFDAAYCQCIRFVTSCFKLFLATDHTLQPILHFFFFL